MPELQAIHFKDSIPAKPTGAFFACDVPVCGFETSAAAFFGNAHDRLNPVGLKQGLSGSRSGNEWSVGVLEIKVDLKPGGEFSFNVFTGRGYEEKTVRQVLSRFRNKKNVEKALSDVKEYWINQRKALQVKLPDENMERSLNCWGQYGLDITMRFRQQPVYGYRDIFQYCRGFMTLNHAECRKHILKALQYQYSAGNSLRGYHPINNEHNMRDARDGVSWIADTICQYIKESGDTDILKKVVPYFDKGSGTVLDHALRAVDFLFKNRGRHKMCLVGGGDWNDALHLGGGKGRGESVWLTIATCRALRFTIEIADYIGQSNVAEKLKKQREQLVKDINANAWDGDWYIYGFTDKGDPVGSKTNKEGKIYSNVQSWALMEDIVPENRKAKIWKNVEDYLCTDIGVSVLHPAYTKYNEDIGRISAMMAGSYENASVYSHGTTFYIAALSEHKNGKRAVEMWNMLSPTNKLNPHSGEEPYASPIWYAGPGHPHFGYCDCSWVSGSVSWRFFISLEKILGIKPEFNGLLIDPAIPSTWKSYEVKRIFRGAEYHIAIKNPDNHESGVKEIKVDNKAILGNVVPIARPGKIVKVDVVM